MELQATRRTILGKKVKSLRRQGITPAHLFGRDMESQALQLTSLDFNQVLITTGRNALVDLAVTTDGKGRAAKSSYKVMVREIQRNPITAEILHVDLYRVLLTERMQVEVPVALVGVAPAVDRNLGTLVQSAREIRVEGLPGTLPSTVQVDITGLEEPHQAVHTSDIQLPEGITLVSDPEQVIANIVPLRVAVEVEAVAEEAAAPTAEEAVAPE